MIFWIRHIFLKMRWVFAIIFLGGVFCFNNAFSSPQTHLVVKTNQKDKDCYRYQYHLQNGLTHAYYIDAYKVGFRKILQQSEFVFSKIPLVAESLRNMENTPLVKSLAELLGVKKGAILADSSSTGSLGELSKKQLMDSVLKIYIQKKRKCEAVDLPEHILNGIKAIVAAKDGCDAFDKVFLKDALNTIDMEGMIEKGQRHPSGIEPKIIAFYANQAAVKVLNQENIESEMQQPYTYIKQNIEPSLQVNAQDRELMEIAGSSLPCQRTFPFSFEPEIKLIAGDLVAIALYPDVQAGEIKNIYFALRGIVLDEHTVIAVASNNLYFVSRQALISCFDKNDSEYLPVIGFKLQPRHSDYTHPTQ